MKGSRTEHRFLAFSSLLGGIASAMTRAQGQLHGTTLSHLLSLGGTTAAEHSDPNRLPSLGFRYSQPAPDGQPEVQTAHIPLLSFIEVPNLRLEQCEIELAARVVRLPGAGAPPAPAAQPGSGRWPPSLQVVCGWLPAPLQVAMSSPGRQPGASATLPKLRLRLRLTQDPIAPDRNPAAGPEPRATTSTRR